MRHARSATGGAGTWDRSGVFGARTSGAKHSLLKTADLVVGMKVLYAGRAATLQELGTGTLRDGSTIPLARLRFPRGGVTVVFASQLQAADG